MKEERKEGKEKQREGREERNKRETQHTWGCILNQTKHLRQAGRITSGAKLHAYSITTALK